MDAHRIGDLTRTLSLATITSMIPYSTVRSALEATGTASRRERLLPAPMVVYLVVLLALFSDVSVKENMRILMDVLTHQFGVRLSRVPAGSAISKARQRLGRAPFERVFREIARPVAELEGPGAPWHGLRVVAADGTDVDVQHTRENVERYGIHSNQHGSAGYPAMQAVVVLECATRVPLAAATGAVHEEEASLFDTLLGRLSSDMLLLVDRHYYSFDRWKACSARCGALVWRIRSNIHPRELGVLEDGSLLVELRPSNKLIRKGRASPGDRLRARLIEFEPVFADGSTGERTRLLTTLLDAATHPAQALANEYTERWGAETSFDELKTHLRGRDRVLRAQLPDLVEQEFFGFLLAYYVTRATMARAAAASGIPPTRLSFVHTVRVIRRKLAFPPSDA
jgi:hypothetical protein